MGWLAASLHLSDGRTIRLGGDEAEVENQPSDLSFDTSSPGGFGSASITLPRPANLTADDGKLFSHLEIYGEAGTVYEGMVTGVPQVGDEFIRLNLSGWVTALDRHETFTEIYVDRDLSRWGNMTAARRVALLTLNLSAFDPSVNADDGSDPQLVLSLSDTATQCQCEALYDAGANRIGSIYYDYSSHANAASQPGTGFALYILTATETTTYAGGSTTGDIHTVAAGTGSGTLTSTTPAQYGVIRWHYTTSLGNTEYEAHIGPLAVYGDHGLTKRGSAPEGFYASDVVGHILEQCPSLSVGPDSIEQTGFVIPHLVFDTDTSLRSAVEQMSALGGTENVPMDWGVYEDREFFWRSPGTYGRTWHVRKDQVAKTASDGPDADRRVAGVKVNYTDPAGTAKSVGPPGSNADTETEALLDLDPDNPAFRIPGAFKSESVGITTEQGAINIGILILNERNRLDWRGTVEVQGYATDERGITYPAAMIRAGDQIVVTDSDDPTPRSIISTSYSHDSLTTTAAIGAAPDSLEVLLSQLAAVTDLIGQ